jgi:hypothetical protein
LPHISILRCGISHHSRRIFFPQKPQQIRMSSPSNQNNFRNSHLINHLLKKNSWHSSYAPLDTIN